MTALPLRADDYRQAAIARVAIQDAIHAMHAARSLMGRALTAIGRLPGPQTFDGEAGPTPLSMAHTAYTEASLAHGIAASGVLSRLTQAEGLLSAAMAPSVSCSHPHQPHD